MPNPNINRRVVLTGMRLDASTVAIIDRMAALGSEPSAERKIKMNALVLNLKGQGVYGSTNVWNKLDIIQPYYAETAIQALVEWKMKDGAGVYDATAVNSPTFTANQGYTANAASTRYVRTNFARSSGTNYTTNTCCWGGYYTGFTAGVYLSGIEATGNWSWIRTNNADNTNVDQRNNSNGAANGHFGLAGVGGLFLSNRNSASEFKTIKNDTVVSTMATAAVGVSSIPFVAHGLSQGATTANNIPNNAVCWFWIAGGNLEADRSQLYNSLLAYIS